MIEDQNIEYKESWRDEYLKWICGFANANGGVIYIGKNDAGEIVGLKDSKKLLEDIPNILILGRFAKAKLLRMSYTERNSSNKFANLFRFGIKQKIFLVFWLM